MIVIITNRADPHADSIIEVLNSRRLPVFRLNADELLTHYDIEFNISNKRAPFIDLADTVGRTVDFTTARSIWLRRIPRSFDLHETPINVGLELIQSELHNTFDALLSASPNAIWINNPTAANAARVKWQQLILARELGMDVPASIVTANPQKAINFSKSIGSDLVVKSIYTSNVDIDGTNYGIPTARITHEQLCQRAPSIALCPTLLQEYCDKEYELRITIFGDKIFAVRLDSQSSDVGAVDWRIDADRIPHSLYVLPDNVESFVRQFMARQGLLYGAMDFIRTPQGRYVFLENNPYGQFLWLEDRTGAPMMNALIDLLAV